MQFTPVSEASRSTPRAAIWVSVFVTLGFLIPPITTWFTCYLVHNLESLNSVVLPFLFPVFFLIALPLLLIAWRSDRKIRTAGNPGASNTGALIVALLVEIALFELAQSSGHEMMDLIFFGGWFIIPLGVCVGGLVGAILGASVGAGHRFRLNSSDGAIRFHILTDHKGDTSG